MTRLVSWPTLTATTTKIADVRDYYYNTTVTLADGRTVRPTLKTAKAVVDLAHMGLPLPMAVEFGSWR